MATAKSKTSKPASAKKTTPNNKGSKPATPQLKIVSSEVTPIPLDKLALSPKNVRKVKANEKDDQELKASIFENGLKQNLAGYEDGEGGYLIDAGGRRLKALQELSAEGKIATDHPVNCLIEDEYEATITSIVENTHRAAMHPADQFVAFNQLIEEGRSEDEIAIKFGVSVDIVRKRLKLARVAPEIIDEFRKDEINLEHVMAFTLTDDHDRQRTIWESVKDGYMNNPNHIRSMITQSKYAASSKLARFVTVKAYVDAGGEITSDLFQENNNTYLDNPELLERLASEKLQSVAEQYVGDWKWVDSTHDLEYDALRSFGRVDAEEVEPNSELTAKINVLKTRDDELRELSNERDLTDEEDHEYQAIDEQIEDLEEQIKDEIPYAEDARKIAGVIVSLNYQGKVEINKGLVRPEDIPNEAPKSEGDESADVEAAFNISTPTSSRPSPSNDPAAVERKSEGITAGLASDLKTQRHHILRAHLSGDFGVAFDVMLYTMISQALSHKYLSDMPLDAAMSDYYDANRNKLVADSIGEKMLTAMKADLRLEWTQHKQPEDFKALCALPTEDKQALFAWATAYTLKAQLASDSSPNPIIEEIGALMEVDVAACWRPTAANYWGTVTKAHIGSVAKELISDDYSEERLSEKKGEAAAAMESAFAETAAITGGMDEKTVTKTTRWLPKGMEFVQVNSIENNVEEGVNEKQDTAEVSDANEAELPTFLSDADAA